MNANKTVSRAKALTICLLLLGAAAPFGGDSGLVAQVVSRAVTPDPALARAIAEQRKRVESQSGATARATALNDLANLLELGGDIAAAFETYRAAIAADGTWAPAHYNLALLAYRTGDAELASNHLETAIELAPGSAWAHYQLGRIADDADDAENAVEHYTRAVSLDSRLAFGDVNPHFLVNRHATEVLLRADRESVKALPPRTYSEPRRISGLLLPAQVDDAAPRSEALAESREVQEAVQEDEAATSEQSRVTRSVKVGADRPREENRLPAPSGIGGVRFQEPTINSVTFDAPDAPDAPDAAGVRDEPPAAVAGRRSGSEPRVFTRENLRSRTLAAGGAVAVSGGGRQPSSSPVSGRRGAVQVGSPVGPSGRQPAPAPGTFGGSRGGRFEPSARSSAQLDLTIRRFPAPAP